MTAGKPFSLKPKLVDTHLLAQTAVLSMAELTQPICCACLAVGRRPYCQRCVESGAAMRHANHPHRQAGA